MSIIDLIGLFMACVTVVVVAGKLADCFSDYQGLSDQLLDTEDSLEDLKAEHDKTRSDLADLAKVVAANAGTLATVAKANTARAFGGGARG